MGIGDSRIRQDRSGAALRRAGRRLPDVPSPSNPHERWWPWVAAMSWLPAGWLMVPSLANVAETSPSGWGWVARSGGWQPHDVGAAILSVVNCAYSRLLAWAEWRSRMSSVDCLCNERWMTAVAAWG